EGLHDPNHFFPSGAEEARSTGGATPAAPASCGPGRPLSACARCFSHQTQGGKPLRKTAHGACRKVAAEKTTDKLTTPGDFLAARRFLQSSGLFVYSANARQAKGTVRVQVPSSKCRSATSTGPCTVSTTYGLSWARNRLPLRIKTRSRRFCRDTSRSATKSVKNSITWYTGASLRHCCGRFSPPGSDSGDPAKTAGLGPAC